MYCPTSFICLNNTLPSRGAVVSKLHCLFSMFPLSWSFLKTLWTVLILYIYICQFLNFVVQIIVVWQIYNNFNPFPWTIISVLTTIYLIEAFKTILQTNNTTRFSKLIKETVAKFKKDFIRIKLIWIRKCFNTGFPFQLSSGNSYSNDPTVFFLRIYLVTDNHGSSMWISFWIYLRRNFKLHSRK